MTSLDDLIEKARDLRTEGHSPGQIADELSLSLETVTWLLIQDKNKSTHNSESPRDVHIDWTNVSSDALLLEQSAMMLTRLFTTHTKLQTPPTTIVGIAISGIPLATCMATTLESKLAIFHPAKHNAEHITGSLSGNFAGVKDETCLIVDDVITSGRTIHDVITYLVSRGATPVGCCVLFDKRGIKCIDEIDIYSLYSISRID
ncbi:MAG: orotate phosphoribosyltransferase-like protein [Methanomicrobiales archaeon]|nr:orotate phosphoribosyltransferase-like protein [Methanomicrobiales archaeon]